MELGKRLIVWVLVIVPGWSGGLPDGCLAFPVNEGCVQFDAPTSVIACDVTPPEMTGESSGERLVQLNFPVSTRLGCTSRQAILQMQIEIKSTGPGIQIVDYAPRTSLYSEIDGPIAVESREESSHSLGFDAGGTVAEMVKLGANAGTGKTTGYSERYQRIPHQKLLLASGTLQRGTAVYFKFNPSPQTTLEGGHELSITLRVPATWRGGILRVDCRADGSEPGLLGRHDRFVAGSSSFMVATWLKGDSEAQAIVSGYCEIESRLRQIASSRERRQKSGAAGDPVAQLSQLFRGSTPNLPEGWSEQFMLYDTRSIQSQIRPHLSRELQAVTDQYLASRAQVLRLAR